MDGRFIFQYDKNNDTNLFLVTLPIKSVTNGTNAIRSPITSGIKQGVLSNPWKIVSHQCCNGIC